ncbi:hypothetical protein [Thermophilibacter immobilis]|mgnify:CR=1 FL=1|jgi:uncharacterized membrane protein YqjE|uniref:Uncharacterized protein n=1 Tax=Thermophilibacter immobilis TaxID=2779519 RepID=A0A7S7M8Q9_9ACTN|nr:hypothetical protein [Thermophilibacter immobilis]QOY60764.1 hypothetical protein INP52_00625 [Thermophilibacter immobilis]
MDFSTAIVAGGICGLVGCVTPAVVFERALRPGTRVSMSAGIASIMVSFLVLSGVLLVVYLVTDTGLLEFGCAMVASFLLFWAVEALRAWRAANGRAQG